MNPALLALLLVRATAGGRLAEEILDDIFPEPPPPPPPPPPRPPRALTPMDVACPRCHAEPGKPCDRRTLSRTKHYHLARVQLAQTPQE